MHLVALARPGDRDLTLEVELLLPADLGASRQPVRRAVDRRPRIAARHAIGRLQQRAGRHRRLDGQDRRLGPIVDPRQPRRRPRLGQALGRDEEQRLPGIVHLARRPLAGRQHRLVLHDRPGVVDTRHVVRRRDPDDARRRPHGVQPDRPDPGVRVLGQRNVAMQQVPRLGHVVGIGRRPRDVPVGRVVPPRRMHAVAHLRGRHVGLRVHHATASTSVATPGSVVSMKYRSSRLPATRIR